ncbi:transcriptional regulator [Salinivibrio sp. KP-1]|uniref:transcriptional regulator n=1 Tax=Salinivibrio sp. KP-1 TaxID=1406902 RepID=UPI0018CE94AC|nr:transcriptional regulator [Salinivibrio sp. KP-1]
MDKAKSCQGLPSDYALAKKLNLKPSTVSKWRVKKSIPEWSAVFELVDLAGDTDQNVVWRVLQEKEENPRLINTLRKGLSCRP